MDLETLDKERLFIRNYIIFSYITDFIKDLSESYSDEALHAFKRTLETTDLTKDMTVFNEKFVQAFASNDKILVQHSPGIYVKVYKFLDRKDSNREIIEKWISNLREIFKNPYQKSKEFMFLQEKIDRVKAKQEFKILENPSQSESENEYMKKVLSALTPDISQTCEEFKKRKLNVEKCVKIISLLIFSQMNKFLDNIPEQDKKTLIFVVGKFINTPISQLNNRAKLFEFAKLLCSVSNFPYAQITQVLSANGVSTRF